MRKTWIVLGVLIVALILLSIYWKHKNPPIDGVLVVQDERQALFDDWHKLDMIDITTCNDESFKGYTLEQILAVAGVDDGWERVIFVSDDGARTVLHRESAARPHLALVRDDGESYFRLVLPDDEFKHNWLKYIRRIELE